MPHTHVTQARDGPSDTVKLNAAFSRANLCLIWTCFRQPQLKGRKYEAPDNISVLVFILINSKNDGSRFDHYHRKPNDGPCNPQASCPGGQNDGESERSFEILSSTSPLPTARYTQVSQGSPSLYMMPSRSNCGPSASMM